MPFKDKFSDRLMIPIWDKRGDVVGFTGRIIAEIVGIDRPKYLNSPETEWFKKGKLWYGLNLAKGEVRKNSFAILLEGNMDVIAAHNFGLTTAIACQGTSFGLDQIKELKYITKTLYLAFDNDTAGRISSDKFFRKAIQFGFEIKKLIIPIEYKDLDEYLLLIKKRLKTEIELGEIANQADPNSETQKEISKNSSSFETKPEKEQIEQNLSVSRIDQKLQQKLEQIKEMASSKILQEYFQTDSYLEYTWNNLEPEFVGSPDSQKKAITHFFSLLVFCGELAIAQYLQKLQEITKLNMSLLKNILAEQKEELKSELVNQKTMGESEDVQKLSFQTQKQKRWVHILPSLQKLIVCYQKLELGEEINSKIPLIYVLVRYLLLKESICPKDILEENFEDYLSEHTQELELIQLEQKINIAQAESLVQLLIGFLLSNSQKLFVEAEIGEIYQLLF